MLTHCSKAVCTLLLHADSMRPSGILHWTQWQ